MDDDDDEGYWPQVFPEVIRMTSLWRDPRRTITAIEKTDEGFIVTTREVGR